MTFPAYPEYKDSGVEWLGAVPEHWGVKQLRYLGRFRKGLTITKADLVDTGIPCLNYGEVHSLYPFEVNQDIQPLKSVPAEYLETDPSACVKYGDFVFADTSEDLDGVGNFTHVSGLGPLFSGYHTIIYSLDSEVSSRFLAYCLDSFAFRTQLRLGVKGVKVFSVTQEILRGGTAWLPTTAEQTQIARFLDHETARIDALIEEQQRLIELLKEKRQAVISHAVTKGLDPTVPKKASGVEWLGEVPAHWLVLALKWRARIKSGDGISPDFIESQAQEDKPYPVVGGNGVMGFTSQANISPPLIVIGRVGALCGNVHKIHDPAWVSDNALILDFERRSFDINYLAHVLNARNLNDISDKSAQPLITGSKVTSQYFPCPSHREQLAISHFLEGTLSEFDQLMLEAFKGIELLKERRSALISASVTGKIDVRGWQPPVSIQAPTLEVAEAN